MFCEFYASYTRGVTTQGDIAASTEDQTIPLTDCRECGREVAHDAKVCPGCGAEYPGSKINAERWVAIGCFGLIAAAAVVWFLVSQSEQRESERLAALAATLPAYEVVRERRHETNGFWLISVATEHLGRAWDIGTYLIGDRDKVYTRVFFYRPSNLEFPVSAIHAERDSVRWLYRDRKAP